MNTLTIMNNILRINKLHKNYHSKDGVVIAIEDITLSIKEGEYVAIVGPSGCGKSTLLNIIGGIDTKSGGEINMSSSVKIGYMLQNDCLFPWLNILDNCLLGLKINGNLNEENTKYEKAKLMDELAVKLNVAQDGFRVVANCGLNGGQEVMHIHYHLLAGRKLGSKV